MNALILQETFLIMYATLQTLLADSIFTIYINRPDKLNALNKTVMDELQEAINEVYTNKNIKAAIIIGSGEKSFVAGADISEFSELSVEEGKRLSQKGNELFMKIEQSPKPIIGCINGYALGGGCELAMSCHFRIAADNAKFGQPEVNLGLIPGYGGTQRLAQLIGKGRALEMLLTGNLIDAQTAFQWGLVNYVVPQIELLSKAISILSVICNKAPLAVEKCIACVNALYDKNKNGFEEEIKAFGDCFGTEDMKEGTKAFLEKRAPVFIGK